MSTVEEYLFVVVIGVLSGLVYDYRRKAKTLKRQLDSLTLSAREQRENPDKSSGNPHELNKVNDNDQ